MSFLYLTLVIVVGVPTGFPHPTTIVNPWRLQLCCLSHGHATQKPKVSSMLGSQVTPQSCPWPPTACTGCSCPSGQSEGSQNGPKWFPIPKNMGFKKNPKSLACSEVKLLHEAVLDLLQPIQAVLDLQVNMRSLTMVQNDSQCPKT